MARPGFSFLVCADSALLKEEIEKQIKRLEPQALNWERRVFWGDDEQDSRFWGSLDQAGLFEQKRIVVMRRAEQLAAQVWQDISNRLARELGSVWPFFCLEIAPEGREQKIPAAIAKLPCWKYAEQKKWILRPAQRDARAGIKQLANERELSFAEGAFETLTFAVRACPWQQIVTEMDKLALVAKDGVVTTEMIDIDQSAHESGAFPLVNAIRAGNLATALAESANDADGSLLFFAIAVLDRELREKWQELSGARGNPYRQGRQLSASAISQGFTALANAEWQVKSGRLNPGQALEALCSEMTRVYQ